MPPPRSPNDKIKRAATISDVAKLAGVSRSAVSRAYTPGASVSRGARQKISEAASSLGYRPNLIARSLITRRSMTVAVAITRLGNPFHAEVLESLSIELAHAGYRALLFMMDAATDIDPVMDEVLRNRVDAVILTSIRLTSNFADECRAAGIPVVLLNRRVAGDRASAVVGDNRHGGRSIAAFLDAGGHDRFAYLAGSDASSTSREREDGYFSYFAERGKAAPLRAVSNYDVDQAKQAVRDMLAAPDAPDALFCANDLMAITAMDIARQDFGKVVGKDLSIVGFDGVASSGWSGVALTTFSQSPRAMAQHTVRLLIDTLESGDASPVTLVVGGSLIVRTSARIPSDAVDVDGREVWRPPTP